MKLRLPKKLADANSAISPSPLLVNSLSASKKYDDGTNFLAQGVGHGSGTGITGNTVVAFRRTNPPVKFQNTLQTSPTKAQNQQQNSSQVNHRRLKKGRSKLGHGRQPEGTTAGI